ncbi:FecR family protein [Bacteroides sp.]
MTTNDHHPVTDEDIRLYLCDALSPDRRAEIRRWFSTEEGQLYLSEIIDEDVARILSGEELQSSEPIEIRPLRISDSTEKNKKQTQKTIGWWLRHAAVWIPAILLLAIGGYTYYNQQQSPEFAEIYVPKGDMQTIIFQDGTKVILNADSRLKYTPGFKLFSREVELEGEAYFEVAKNKIRPFTVHTSGVDIKVLGTKFNIKAYNDESDITTTLNQGHVRVSDMRGEALELFPGEQIVYEKKNGTMYKRSLENVSDYSAWKTNSLCFTDTRLDHISKELSRKFNKEIVLMDPSLENSIYTISFNNMPLDSILEDLTRISPVRYEKVDDKILIYKIK